VTVPRVGAVPLLVTLSVFLGTAAAIVNGNALDALDPEFIAETQDINSYIKRRKLGASALVRSGSSYTSIEDVNRESSH
jgi:hypothetical protein